VCIRSLPQYNAHDHAPRENKRLRVQARVVLEFWAATAAKQQCAECAVLMDDSAERADEFRSLVLTQREECKGLLGNTTLLFLKPNERYALVPRAWLAQWRRWISSSPWKEQSALAVARAGTAAAARGVESLTSALSEYTVKVDGELRMLLDLPPLKAHREKWCQVLHSSLGRSVLHCSLRRPVLRFSLCRPVLRCFSPHPACATLPIRSAHLHSAGLTNPFATVALSSSCPSSPLTRCQAC
jgi:hypothetical protein